MKLKEFLKEKLHKTPAVTDFNHTTREFEKVTDESFTKEEIKASMLKARKLKSYKEVIGIAKENTSTRQESNGSMAFDVEGTNGYYFTINGYLRYYGEEFDTGGNNLGRLGKNHKQGRLDLNNPIKVISPSLNEKAKIDQLVARYDNLLKSLLRVIKKKVVTESSDEKFTIEEQLQLALMLLKKTTTENPLDPSTRKMIYDFLKNPSKK